jgi:hypothetical protein
MESKYFIFDMDETLAELYSVYYFVSSLRLKETIEEDNKYVAENIPPALLNSLNKAYTIFVNDVLKEEKSSKPLGILRPGILNVMSKLYELQKAGKVKNIIIYSNNGHLESLEFIRDLIHEHLGTTQLIKECIHWNHPMRDEERHVRPGAANKTWNVIKNIMVNGNCKASPQVEPKDVYFFDDLDHIDLQEKLGNTYYKVPGYNFKASFDRLASIYSRALNDTRVNIEEFMDYIIDLYVDTSYEFLKAENESVESVIEIFRGKTSGTASDDVMPPGPDGGIAMMMEAIKRVGILGGKRRREYKFGTRKRRVRRRNVKTMRKN